MRALSGIKPTGDLHLGNYFGAMRQHLELQHECEGLYFIANYHSMTTVKDADYLRTLTRNVALDYLAMGLDPQKVSLFRQSDVPEVTELMWILACVTGKGLMDRATTFKDHVAKGITPNMGVYCYPLLMAADILIYRSNIVPVGKDQLQHVEFAQDMATYFNETYRPVLVRPEARLGESPIVPGIDGRKMSKSYDNFIELFGTPKAIRKKIMAIKTDSTPVEEPKDPESDNVFALIRLLATPEETAEWDQRYRAGGMGYGDAKKRLFELYEEQLGAKRAQREQWAARPDDIEEVLRSGARHARAIAQELMDEVRSACGIVRAPQT